MPNIAQSTLQVAMALRWILLILALYVLQKIIYTFFLSPVRHVPGPWYCHLSRLPLLYATYQRRRTPFTTSLIKKYGPIVVIAPNQIHTTFSSAMKPIYSKSSTKTPFYSGMGSWKGVTTLLGKLDYESAVPNRNILLQIFQNKNLATLVGSIEGHIDEFLGVIGNSVEKGEKVDGVVIFRLLALDIVTDVLWGEKKTLLSDADSNFVPDLVRRFRAFSTWNAMRGFIPGLDFWVRNFGNKRWRGLRKDCNDLDLTARAALQRWDDDLEKRRDKDVLSMLQGLGTPGNQIKHEEIPAYMIEMLAAGSTTTAGTACLACWLLTRHSSAQERLIKELREAFPVSEDMDIKKTMDLPFLDGVIRETMRLYPIIPGPLERYLGSELSVGEIVIPPGVIASTGAYTQGRLADVYPQPDDWRPERWLDADEAMRLNWIPFGYGTRICPAANIAMTDLHFIIGKIFRKYRMVMPPGYVKDEMDMFDVFGAAPKSGHCWLMFEALER